MTVEIHEASHCAAALALGRRVAFVDRDVGHTGVGEHLGNCRVELNGPLGLSQVPICLIGYASENWENWPPAWPDCCEEKRESLGTVLRVLTVDEEDYAALVELTFEVLADPDFVRLRDAIARALARVPRLEREDIETLAAIYPIRDEEQP
jgi:hypothetical protein